MTLIRIMKHELRIMVFIVLSMILASLFMIHTAHAQESSPSTFSLPTTNYQLPTTVSPTSPLYTDLLVHNIFHTFSCIGIGQSIIGQPCLTYQISRNAQGMLQGVPYLSSVDTSGGVLGTTTGLIGLLYENRPVRAADYLAIIGEDLGIVRQANAQVVGSGAQVLNPIRSLWQVSRNISYVIMIIIFLIVGLMVMFRTKINPQTVITAQAALPGLVIGLILITFSYFLAGLISDMAFVGTNVVGYYFAAAQGQTADPERINLVQRISGDSVLRIFGAFAGIAADRANEIVDAIIGSLPTDVASNARIFLGIISAQLVAPLGGLAGPFAPIATALTGIFGTFEGVTNTFGVRGRAIIIIVTAIMIYVMLKLLFRLINSFLTIIFYTISAPFLFLFASLPGRQGIATDWIRNMLGNVLVFPAVIAVFYFIAIILAPVDARLKDPSFPLKVSERNQIQDDGFISSIYATEHEAVQINVVAKATFPLFGGLESSFIRLLLAIGALIALPAIPDLVIRSVSKASEAGQLIGQELGGNVRAGRGYASQAGTGGAQTLQSVSTGIFGESYRGAGGEVVVTRRGILPPGTLTKLWGGKLGSTPAPRTDKT